MPVPFAHEPGKRFSKKVIELNDGSSFAITRLSIAGYMSPQSPAFSTHGFCCNFCDKFRPKNPDSGHCTDPFIKAMVERRGCCNKFEFRGVHT